VGNPRHETIAVGLSVFGLQQSAIWGWGNPAIEVSIAAGVLLLAVSSLWSAGPHRP
jgi:hypothetical protein